MSAGVPEDNRISNILAEVAMTAASGVYGNESPYNTATGLGHVTMYNRATGSGQVPMYNTATGSGQVPMYSTASGSGHVPMYSRAAGSGHLPIYNRDTGSGQVPMYNTATGSGHVPMYNRATGSGHVPTEYLHSRRNVNGPVNVGVTGHMVIPGTIQYPQQQNYLHINNYASDPPYMDRGTSVSATQNIQFSTNLCNVERGVYPVGYAHDQRNIHVISNDQMYVYTPVNDLPNNVHPANAKPANAKPVNVYPVNAQHANANPANAKSANAQPANAQPNSVGCGSVVAANVQAEVDDNEFQGITEPGPLFYLNG